MSETYKENIDPKLEEMELGVEYRTKYLASLENKVIDFEEILDAETDKVNQAFNDIYSDPSVYANEGTRREFSEKARQAYSEYREKVEGIFNLDSNFNTPKDPDPEKDLDSASREKIMDVPTIKSWIAHLDETQGNDELKTRLDKIITDYESLKKRIRTLIAKYEDVGIDIKSKFEKITYEIHAK